jgi:eukaryotic-like serine/threonine-protein kinase
MTDLQVEDVLAAYVEDYFEALSGLSYADLEARQHGFHASLAFGAAGVAYACWHTALALDEPELLDEAERWLAATTGRERDRLSFLVPQSKLRERPASHFLFGEAGMVFVRALVSHARQEAKARAAAIRRFADLSLAAREGSPELYNGTAGCLAGLSILLAYTGDVRLRDTGAELADDLAGRAVPDEDGIFLWPELQGLGLSHGSSGPCLALLLHSAATGSPLPEWYAPSVERMLRLALDTPSRLCPTESHHAMFCNGFAGLAFLGARVFRTLGGRGLLEAARQAGLLALATTSGRPDLCCGRAGAAYACLALSQVDPEGPWKTKATDLALSTLLCERGAWRKAGLYGGEAAIPCLASSLITGAATGPPALDLPDWPERPAMIDAG